MAWLSGLGAGGDGLSRLRMLPPWSLLCRFCSACRAPFSSLELLPKVLLCQWFRLDLLCRWIMLILLCLCVRLGLLCQ